MINSFKNYLVEEEKTVFFTFGRMNPPTTGHEKLLDKLSRKAGRNPYKIYLSQSQDRKKNPLSYGEKIKYARKMFPRHARQIILDNKVKSVFNILTRLYDEGFKNVSMVVGSDRLNEFDILLNKYNGKKSTHGFYNFSRINVVSAGERDPDSDNIDGMSASKMRAAASEGDFVSFSQGLPKNVSNPNAKALYNSVRKGMGLKEQKEFKNHVQLKTVSNIREKYIKGNLYNINDTVVIKETDEIAKIKRLGSNYVIIESGGKMFRKWLNDIELIEARTPQDPDIADRKGTQPKKYHTGLAKSTKAARDRQFKKQTKMRDDDPKAYKPAPGDKEAKTKPSKYTIAVKKMMGESYTSWTNQEPVEYAKHLEKTFGKPDEMTDSQLCWFAKDGFKRIVIKDEYILHGSPAPHYDFIYCYIDLIVPEKFAKPLAESSGSILIDYLKGEVGARCGSITANATTLNYVLDVVAGRAIPSKKEYEKRILGMKKMFATGKKYTTDWWPDESGDADPKNPYYKAMEEGIKPFKLFTEQDALTLAKKRINREKERDKIKHDRMMDRARTQATRQKNRETVPK